MNTSVDAAPGINCRGNGNYAKSDGTIFGFWSASSCLDPNHYDQDGELIMCSKGSLGGSENEGYYLFPQNTGNGILAALFDRYSKIWLIKNAKLAELSPAFIPKQKTTLVLES